jgi:hypothetical protein
LAAPAIRFNKPAAQSGIFAILLFCITIGHVTFLTFVKLNVLKVTFLVIFYLRIFP